MPPTATTAFTAWPIVVALLAAALALAMRSVLGQRAIAVLRLFTPGRIVQNFRGMEGVLASRRVGRGTLARRLHRVHRPLPVVFEHAGQPRAVATYLRDTWTTGLVVLRDGRLVHENYALGNDATTRVIAWSVSKSVVSALVGIAVSEGAVGSVHDAVVDYLPALRGTAYHGTTVEQLLQMASGVRFDEAYGKPWSDINRLGLAIALGRPVAKVVAGLPRAQPPGAARHYKSVDTQVLGMLLRAATGMPLADYAASRLWSPLGAGADACWLVDGAGTELAFGGLVATLRDLARFGQLYLDEGFRHGVPVVPADWVRASVAPSAPPIAPEFRAEALDFGYGYQWWVPGPPGEAYLAIGVYHQFVYVDPRRRVVIAKSSAYPDYAANGTQGEREHIALFRAIAEHFTGNATVSHERNPEYFPS